MRVVRYTFDICIHKSYEHDVYTLASVLEKHIMECAGVCGCEVKSSHVERVNAVDVDAVIAEQNHPACTVRKSDETTVVKGFSKEKGDN